MNEPKVAIILPVYNSVGFIQDTVDSIFNNTQYPYWRLIIVESASTDGTKEYCDYLARRFPERVTVIHQSEKKGITNAINTAIKTTTNEDLFLLQDDIIIPKLYRRDWLTEFVKIAKNEDVGLITSQNGGGVSGIDYLDGFRWFGTWSLYIPRRTIERVGMFDENFYPGPGDDIDYTFRVENTGLNKMIAPFCIEHHRLTEHMNDKIEFEIRKNAGYFRKKHNIKPFWSEYIILGVRMLLDERTFEVGGCIDVSHNGIFSGKVEEPYLYEKVSEIVKNFDDNDVMLDIGANTGIVSLMLKKGMSLAFEPVEETFAILAVNSYANSLGKLILPIKEAIYDKEVPYEIIYGDHSGVNSIKTIEKGDKKTKTIDSIINNYIKPTQKIKLIKIDCEGSDYEVLMGALKTIKNHKPILIIENLRENQWTEIGKLGYRFEILGHNIMFTPLKEGEKNTAKIEILK